MKQSISFIFKDYKEGGSLYQHLRQKRKKRLRKNQGKKKAKKYMRLILLPFEFSSEKKFTFLNNYFKIFLKGIFYSEDKEVYENFFK